MGARSALLMAACSMTFAAATHAQSSVPEPSELSLRDVFKLPAGPLGLEPTDKLKSLAGKRVRILGYMVHEESSVPGRMLLAPVPVQTSELADGPADDLPPATIFVHLPQHDQMRQVAHRPGLWVLEGTLDIGDREEKDGRISYLRLRLDAPAAEPSAYVRNSAT